MRPTLTAVEAGGTSGRIAAAPTIQNGDQSLTFRGTGFVASKPGVKGSVLLVFSPHGEQAIVAPQLQPLPEDGKGPGCMATVRLASQGTYAAMLGNIDDNGQFVASDALVFPVD